MSGHWPWDERGQGVEAEWGSGHHQEGSPASKPSALSNTNLRSSLDDVTHRPGTELPTSADFILA